MTSNATAQRHTYWHKHPRGFANECSITRCATAKQAAAAEKNGYERLTLTQLRQHISWVNEENAAWGSNRAFGAVSIKDVMHDAEYDYGLVVDLDEEWRRERAAMDAYYRRLEREHYDL